mgnify:FL=1
MEELLEKILLSALKKNVTDIHLNKMQNKTTVQFRQQGKLYPFQEYEEPIGKNLINYIKFLGNIDLNYLLTPHTGQFEYNLNQKSYSFRVSSIPTMHSENIVIRILHHGRLLDIKELSLHSKTRHTLEHITTLKSGLVIVCGPTGEGKSTTLHALLHRIFEKGRVHIITMEDPIEIVEPAFVQIQMNLDAGINFENSLKQILRHDPDVVMIGEIRDESSAALAVRCALTGCLVLSTLHSKNCLGAIHRLKNLGVSDLDLRDTLQYVMSQRLIYSKQTTFSIYEWIDDLAIQQLLTRHEIVYKDFIAHIKESIELGETRIEDYENSEFKSALFDG